MDTPEADQPWTATRCHRLLRPLLTHVSALRQNRKDIIARAAEWGLNERTTRKKRPCSDSQSAANGQPRKRRNPVTYSKRDRRKGHDSGSSEFEGFGRQEDGTKKQKSGTITRRTLLPNAQKDVYERLALLPIPFSRELRNRDASSPVKLGLPPSSSSQRGCASQKPPRGRKCGHVKLCGKHCSFVVELEALHISARVSALYLNVFHALDALLRATSPLRTIGVATPKSLLAACLRRVPSCIAELEDCERLKVKENGMKSAACDSHVSFGIYEELEALGPTTGWRHLGAVVRAHGLMIVSKAIIERLLDVAFSDLVLRLTAQYMPLWDCEQLVDAAISRQYPSPSGLDERLFSVPSMKPFVALCKPGNEDLCARKLVKLVTEEMLPWEWMLTRDFGHIWHHLTKSLVSKRCSHGNLDALVTILGILCRQLSMPGRRSVAADKLREDAERMLIAEFTSVAAMIILQGENWEPPKESQASVTLVGLCAGGRATYVFQSLLGELERQGTRCRLGTYLVSLCCDLLSLQSAFSIPPFAECRDRVRTGVRGPIRAQYNATATLVALLAQALSHGTAAASDGHLSWLCDLLQTQRRDMPDGYMANLRRDSAFLLAERTGDLRDLAFAERLVAAEKESARRETDTHFCAERYCWDEGLSEWVTVSPAPEIRRSDGPLDSAGLRRRVWPVDPTGLDNDYAAPRDAKKCKTDNSGAAGRPAPIWTRRREPDTMIFQSEHHGSLFQQHVNDASRCTRSKGSGLEKKSPHPCAVGNAAGMFVRRGLPFMHASNQDSPDDSEDELAT